MWKGKFSCPTSFFFSFFFFFPLPAQLTNEDFFLSLFFSWDGWCGSRSGVDFPFFFFSCPLPFSFFFFPILDAEDINSAGSLLRVRAVFLDVVDQTSLFPFHLWTRSHNRRETFFFSLLLSAVSGGITRSPFSFSFLVGCWGFNFFFFPLSDGRRLLSFRLREILFLTGISFPPFDMMGTILRGRRRMGAFLFLFPFPGY